LSSTDAKIPLNNKKKMAIISISIIIITVLAGTTFGLLATNPTVNTPSDLPKDSTTPQPTTQIPWITKGTFATYHGQEGILSMNIEFNARLEVVDQNATHLEIQTSFYVNSSISSIENTTTFWVNREDMNFQPEGMVLTSTDTTQVTLPNFGTRSCTIYQYRNENITNVFYIDNILHWPLKMTITFHEIHSPSYQIDITLVDSNIPGL
jgi:hypothetical protein